MWDREMERWDEERQAWSKREQFLLNQISGLQALVVSMHSSNIRASMLSDSADTDGFQHVKGLPLAIEQVHLSREQGGPRGGTGSSTGAPVSQHPALQEQQYQALSSPGQPPANPAHSSTSQAGSPAASPSIRQSPEASTVPMPAAANGRTELPETAVDAVSLAADLADAISAVTLTDVLTDDNPYATAKVDLPGGHISNPISSQSWASRRLRDCPGLCMTQL